MFCINCGKELTEGAKFCINCGFAVGSAVPAAARSTQSKGRKSNVVSAADTENEAVKKIMKKTEAFGPNGEFGKALDILEEGLQSWPNNVELLENAAGVASLLDNNDKVIKYATRAINLGSSEAQVYSVRGQAYYFTEDNEKAIKDLTYAIKLNGSDSLSYGTRGYAYMILGDFQQAASDFNEALRLDPDNDDYRETLREAEEKLAEDEGAEKASRCITKGWRCLDADEVEKAERYFRKALDVDETVRPGDAWSGLAICSCRYKNYDQALKYLGFARTHFKRAKDRDGVNVCNGIEKEIQETIRRKDENISNAIDIGANLLSLFFK